MRGSGDSAACSLQFWYDWPRPTLASGCGTSLSLSRDIQIPFSELERARLTKTLKTWANDLPGHFRDQLRRGFRIGRNDVVIYESRPAFLAPHDWKDLEVAKFRFVQAAKEWRLYCQFRDLKWRAYQPLPSADTFDELFAEVQRDPTGIFWG